MFVQGYPGTSAQKGVAVLPKDFKDDSGNS